MGSEQRDPSKREMKRTRMGKKRVDYFGTVKKYCDPTDNALTKKNQEHKGICTLVMERRIKRRKKYVQTLIKGKVLSNSKASSRRRKSRHRSNQKS